MDRGHLRHVAEKEIDGGKKSDERKRLSRKRETVKEWDGKG